jgi:centrosomal protein CEP104
MQFLSHQCKIATKVEIFAFLPKTASLKSGADYALNPAEIRFTKIGYFYFNSNETSNFQSRELKTVYLVDITALYIKITLHQCHSNKLNTWNQVGLIAVSVFGDAIATNPQAIPRQANEQGGFQELEYNMQFDEETLNRLRMLEKARQRAEESEDYAEAKKLNEAIENLKRVGVNLQRLEMRRATAVKNRDYDSAAVLKKVGSKLLSRR